VEQLFEQLGIDWHLLLSQAVNFGLLLVILRIFVYKPLFKILHDRRARIEEGLAKATEADQRLKEVDVLGRKRMKEAEAEALGILKKTEENAKVLEGAMLAEAKRKEAEAMQNTEAMLRAKEAEARKMMEAEAAALVKRAIVKAVELSPKEIDDVMIAKAVEAAKRVT
jgi:F-type H+-transporting ATPase subunit b